MIGMMLMYAESYIFDMDGTLWDSSDGVARAWNEVVEKLPDVNIRFTADNIKSVMGQTMDVIADKFFGTENHERNMEIMDLCAAHENEYLLRNGGILYDKLEETLERLSKHSRLFIVSNCQAGYIEAFLKHYGFGKYITDHVCWGDNLLSKGDNIKLIMERNCISDAVYVGDTQGDCDSAYYAGTKFIYASYGFGTADRYDMAISQFCEL